MIDLEFRDGASASPMTGLSQGTKGSRMRLRAADVATAAKWVERLSALQLAYVGQTASTKMAAEGVAHADAGAEAEAQSRESTGSERNSDHDAADILITTADGTDAGDDGGETGSDARECDEEDNDSSDGSDAGINDEVLPAKPARHDERRGADAAQDHDQDQTQDQEQEQDEQHNQGNDQDLAREQDQ